MFRQANKNNCLNTIQGDASNVEFMSNFIKTNKINKAYFSFSLHQIIEDKQKQKEYIESLFNCGIEKILLITTTTEDFNENLITKYIKKSRKIDEKRFQNTKELFSNFNVTDLVTLKIYSKSRKDELFMKIRNKYISTLQLLTNVEIEKLIKNIDDDFNGDFVVYPDFYTYVTINKQINESRCCF